MVKEALRKSDAKGARPDDIPNAAGGEGGHRAATRIAKLETELQKVSM